MAKKKKAPPKPRDPFVQHLIKKKQGAHGKSKKAQRKQEKDQLKKDYLEEPNKN